MISECMLKEQQGHLSESRQYFNREYNGLLVNGKEESVQIVDRLDHNVDVDGIVLLHAQVILTNTVLATTDVLHQPQNKLAPGLVGEPVRHEHG